MAVPIAPGTAVHLTGGTTTRGVIRNCRAETEGYSVGLLRQSADRRASPRRLVSGAATVVWEDAEGSEQSLRAEVVNVSKGGVQIQTPRDLPVPTIVFLLGKDVEAMAETLYCEARDSIFVVGLRFKTAPDNLSSNPE